MWFLIKDENMCLTSKFLFKLSKFNELTSTKESTIFNGMKERKKEIATKTIFWTCLATKWKTEFKIWLRFDRF